MSELCRLRNSIWSSSVFSSIDLVPSVSVDTGDEIILFPSRFQCSILSLRGKPNAALVEELLLKMSDGKIALLLGKIALLLGKIALLLGVYALIVGVAPVTLLSFIGIDLRYQQVRCNC
jgi:hypothetical protein